MEVRVPSCEDPSYLGLKFGVDSFGTTVVEGVVSVEDGVTKGFEGGVLKAA